MKVHLPKNVLIVDSDRPDTLKLSMLIKRFGYNVFVATNNQNFMRMAKGIMPHLVLLNVRLPSIEGKSCFEWLRSNKGFDKVHAVVMGEEGDRDLLEQSLKKGARAKIVRPISPTKLFRGLEKLMETTARQVPRLRVIFRVAITTKNLKRETFVTSISEKGAFLYTMKPLPKGTRLRLSMYLPSAKPIELDGEVIYNVEYNSEKLYEPGMAVLFVNVPKNVLLGIRKFVEEQLVGDLDPSLQV
jgi:FixJ family two-component response regulator